MRDLRLKRVLHFVVGFLFGAVACFYLGIRLGLLVQGPWGAFLNAAEFEDALTWGIVGALVGGTLIGLLAVRGLDRFWERFLG